MKVGDHPNFPRRKSIVVEDGDDFDQLAAYAVREDLQYPDKHKEERKIVYVQVPGSDRPMLCGVDMLSPQWLAFQIERATSSPKKSYGHRR